MISRIFPLMLIGSVAASPTQRVLSSMEPGMVMARRLQDVFDDLPDICSGFELIIDEIPGGRDSCECDGSRVTCLFRAICPEGHKEENRCADTVLYEVAFEQQEITILSCASITDGGFDETCAKVSLAADLELDKCLVASYGGLPCDCDVCPDRNSLLLDCSAYDQRAKSDCMAIGLADVTPMVHGFNTSAPPPPEIDQDSIDGESDTESSSMKSESGAVRMATTVMCLVLGIAVPIAAFL